MQRSRRVFAQPLFVWLIVFSLYPCLTFVMQQSTATCLQYATLWVIALWICVCVCVCVHTCMCLSAVLGKIRSAVGSAQLLMSQKFQQFRELCEENLVCVTSSSARSPTPHHPPHNTDIILHKSSWQPSPILICYASSVEYASTHPFTYEYVTCCR